MSYEFTQKWFNNSGIKKEIQKHIPSGNINAPVMMSAFRGSQIILEDIKRKNEN